MNKKINKTVRLIICLFAGLKPFLPIQTNAGLWDVGQGVTVTQGEDDVTRVNLSGQSAIQCPRQLSHAPAAAATNSGGDWGLPRTR